MIRYSGIGFDPDEVAETEADPFGNPYGRLTARRNEAK